MSQNQSSIANDFTGRIVTNIRDPKAFRDVRGEHVIMYPASDADVSIALRLCKQSDRDVVIRSGHNSTSTDEVNGQGAVVINLEALSDISIQGSRVTVGPAVTMEQLAKTLHQNGLFLPLRDTLIKSVVAGILSNEPGMLTRSAGLIASYLHEIHIVKNDGTPSVAKKDDDLFRAVLAREDDGVISKLVFDALADEEAEKFWMSLFLLPYTEGSLKKLISNAFQPGKLPPTVDFAVKLTHANHAIPVVRVSVAGKEGSCDRAAVFRHVERLVSECYQGVTDVEILHPTFTGKEIVKAVMDAGDYGAFSHGCVSTKHSRLVHAGQFPSFVDHYCKVLDTASGMGEDGVMYLPNVFMRSQVCLTTDDNMNVSAYLITPPGGLYQRIGEQDKIEEYKRFLKHVLPLEITPPVRRSLRTASLVGSAPTGFSSQGDILYSNIFNPRSLGSHFPDDPMKLAQKGPKQRIPDFKGEIFMRDETHYTEKKEQYATSSYDPKYMSPYMVTYPVDVQDIQAAIRYGPQEGKKIVARSGGHQYSGMSSGGEDTIVLSMDLFDKKEVDGNLATIGVGCILDDVASFFKENGVTIPHGECPVVGIGGHIQTCGYGHLLRSFGLAIDYVHSFKIVLADGTFKTVHRPKAPNDRQNQNDRIFWAVLGGGPNSFGILTEVTFEYIADLKHPYSRGLKSKYLYRSKSKFGEEFYKIMKEVQRWTREIENGSSEYLLDDLDLMVTAISLKSPLSWFYNGAISVEVVYGNEKGTSENQAQVKKAEEVIKNIRQILDSPTPPLIDFKEDEHKTLSYMSDSFVRRMETTSEGREFDLPYVKRLNATMHALTDGYIKDFADLVQDSVTGSDVCTVFQMGLGGGMHSGHKNRPLTSCSYRDLKFGLVYDVFYKDGNKDVALSYQSRMKRILEQEFLGEGESIRMLWGSYGSTDMNVVYKNYYESKEVYQQLQRIKKEVDSTDVFHTEFTVQLPHSDGNYGGERNCMLN